MLDPIKLYQYLETLEIPSRLLIAFSGGMDSHVLLHALASLRSEHPELVLRAVHIDHGLHADATQWSQHCQTVCQNLNIECLVLRLDGTQDWRQRSLEEVAREQRYQLLSGVLQEDECLLTAHTLDDQAETVLLQMLRGAGVQGLAAMPIVKVFAKGFLARPLLDVSRKSIQDYAVNFNLQWIEDTSNTSMRFDRNYLRHQVLPLLNSRWPAVKPVLARVADHCAEASELLEQLADQDLQLAAGSVPDTLSISVLKTLSWNRQKNLLRFWLRKLELRVPTALKLQQLLQDFLSAAADANPQMQWPGVDIRRFADDLYAFTPLPAHNSQQILSWDLQQPLPLPARIGVLMPEAIPEALQLSPTAAITVRFRQGGERLYLSGRQGSRSLKKLMQEWRIPPWLRDRIPLLYQDECLVAVLAAFKS